ncbi:DUF5684 domain-containing protein [Paratractidigestivibacter sp.]|uniref:DUF5684 domain-containing protein n=1 Tax=Paratractidigestivibacter sp. TaxID=2847316 RepID=UPI002ABD72C6|nr:DUF5684 domain-containing protein [Paratractidigestivibacter sp.]
MDAQINNYGDLMNVVKDQTPSFMSAVGAGGSAPSLIAVLLMAVFLALIAAGAVLLLVGTWKTVKKLGGRGWSQVIPVFRDYEMASVAGCDKALTIAYTVCSGVFVLGQVGGNVEGLRALGNLVSLPMFVLGIIVARQVARRFGKGAGFTFGLVVLPFVFYMILGCGKAQPVDDGPAASAGPADPVGPAMPAAA